jgi:hypothetical protein
MENQQTLNDFPTIDVWVDTDGSPLIKVDYDYIFQGNHVSLDYNDAFYSFFRWHFEKYVKSIKRKRIGHDVVNQNNINLVVAPCPDFPNLVDSIENITPELYHWCKSNNVKIAVCLTRETPFINDVPILDMVIQDSLINRRFKPSVVKIIMSGYDYPNNMCYPNYVVPIDIWRRTLSFMISGTKNDSDQIKLSKNRKYNFSLLTGALYTRWHRVLFLAKCNHLNLLDDKFFYSVCALNEKRDLDYIKELTKEYETYGPYIEADKSIFKHRTYDKDGKLMTSDETIYDNIEEYFTPPQVLDSYVHIVLETVHWAPTLTEKIFKPIVAGLPFVWHGHQDILPYLESLGFKRYSHIDYSFDSNPNPLTRLELLIKEVQRLNKMDLKMLAYTNRKISKHNQQVFKSICKDYGELWEKLK